jgi:hypothetical protein
VSTLFLAGHISSVCGYAITSWCNILALVTLPANCLIFYPMLDC